LVETFGPSICHQSIITAAARTIGAFTRPPSTPVTIGATPPWETLEELLADVEASAWTVLVARPTSVFLDVKVPLLLSPRTEASDSETPVARTLTELWKVVVKVLSPLV